MKMPSCFNSLMISRRVSDYHMVTWQRGPSPLLPSSGVLEAGVEAGVAAKPPQLGRRLNRDHIVTNHILRWDWWTQKTKIVIKVVLRNHHRSDTNKNSRLQNHCENWFHKNNKLSFLSWKLYYASRKTIVGLWNQWWPHCKVDHTPWLSLCCYNHHCWALGDHIVTRPQDEIKQRWSENK